MSNGTALANDNASAPISPEARAALFAVMRDPNLTEEANQGLMDNFLLVTQLTSAQAEDLRVAIQSMAAAALNIADMEERVRFMLRRMYQALVDVLTPAQEQRLRDRGHVLFIMHEGGRKKQASGATQAAWGGALALGALGVTAYLFARMKK